MFMHQDWLMRQIEMMTIAIAQLLLGKGGKEYDWKEDLGQEQAVNLKKRLIKLLDEGRLSEAEDLLFFELDGTDRSILATAIDFYQRANELSDEELKAQGFERSELWDGLGEVVERYGLFLSGFWDET